MFGDVRLQELIQENPDTMFRLLKKNCMFYSISALVVAFHVAMIIWIARSVVTPLVRHTQKHESLVVHTVPLDVKPIEIAPLPAAVIEEIQQPASDDKFVSEPVQIVQEDAPMLEEVQRHVSAPESISLPEPEPVEIAHTEIATIEPQPQTIVPPVAASKPVEVTPSTAKIDEKKAPPVPKSLPKPKPEPKPKAAPSKAESKGQPAAPPPKNLEKNKQLLAKAQENIAKIRPTSDKVNSGKLQDLQDMNLKVAASSIPAGKAVGREFGYGDEIKNRLKLMLKLPDYGEVVLKLTLDRAGKVLKMEVVKSTTEGMRRYVEKSITGLMFPPFGGHFEGEPQHTFSITLSSGL